MFVMKKLVTTLAVLLSACNDLPPRQVGSKRCYWDKEQHSTVITNGTCYQEGRAYACVFERHGDPQVVCASTCSAPAESSSVKVPQ